MVPLGTLATVEKQPGPRSFPGTIFIPRPPINGQAAPGFSSGQAMELMEQMAERKLPASMGYEWTGMSFQEKRVGGQAIYVFGLAVLMVYLVLAAQYESWTMPAAVILVVPLALLGTVAAVSIRGMDNNVYTQIGIVLIIALASKNAILIVEFARELRGTRPADPGCGRRGLPAAVPADPDDIVRVHPGHLPAGERHRRRRRQPSVAGNGGLRRDDRRDGAGRLLRAGLLRGDAAPGRAAAAAEASRVGTNSGP